MGTVLRTAGSGYQFEELDALRASEGRDIINNI